MLLPRQSAKFIADNSKNISIDTSKVKSVAIKVATAIKEHKLGLSCWNDFPVHPKLTDEHNIDWIFLVDALNFSFWSLPNVKCEVTWGGKPYTGYMALCAAINKAMMKGSPILDPNFYRDVTEDELFEILQYDNGEPFPMLKERVTICHEIGTVLVEKYNGSFLNVLKLANNSVMKLLQLITTSFPCFCDQGTYDGQAVSFWKRAQILAADVWSCFEGKKFGYFEDIDELTMFADYRVPQVLGYLGVFKYSQHLLDLLKTDNLMDYGCQEEMEIRGCSIWAVELITEETKKLLKEGDEKVNAILVDYYLWLLRREFCVEVEKVFPFHKVRSIYY